MSEIFSKSIHMSRAGAAQSTAVKNKADVDDLLFAALFGGATDDISSDGDNDGSAAFSGVFAVPITEKDDLEISLQEASLATIAVLQAAKGFDQKQVGKVKNAVVENNGAGSASENSDALADMSAAGPLGPHIDPPTGDVAKGTTPNPLQNTKSIRANLAFEDGRSSGQANANLPKIRLATMQSSIYRSPVQTLPMVRTNGVKQPAGEPAATSQVAVPKTFVGPMPALSADAKMAANIATLRVIREANLEQRNSEINAKLSGHDNVDVGRPDKTITTAVSFKQALITNSSVAVGDRMPTGASISRDTARPSQAVSDSVNSASGTNVQSLLSQAGGQSGGQTGGQSGGQAGAAAGGSLLNNLNMLQTLDMAKNNWTEMLLQRVQKGLAGGKDQLDFQLNPRNLGKMQISLVIQNDRTNIHIQTETSAAASMLNDSEARLSQMLEASGLRLGNLNSGQSQGFSGNMSGGHSKQQNQAETSGNADANESKDQSLTKEQSENLINIQA